jgi:flagellar biosynthesis/type III secretory pathway M-ring protein FliF/YscJ
VERSIHRILAGGENVCVRAASGTGDKQDTAQRKEASVSTTAWIIVIIVVAVVVVAVLAWMGRRRSVENRRFEATQHRDEAQERAQRAARADAAASELNAVAERERVAARESAERARDVDPDIDDSVDEPAAERTNRS